jgi:hypothetical protein
VQIRPEEERRLKATEQAYKKLEDDYVTMKESHPTVVVILDAHDMPVSTFLCFRASTYSRN